MTESSGVGMGEEERAPFVRAIDKPFSRLGLGAGGASAAFEGVWGSLAEAGKGIAGEREALRGLGNV